MGTSCPSVSMLCFVKTRKLSESSKQKENDFCFQIDPFLIFCHIYCYIILVISSQGSM